MWFKVDDRLAHHPKVISAGNAAIGLWVRAGSWSAAHLTDGFVSAELVTTLGGKKATVDALVRAGLWIAEPGGYRFKDWTDYQPSASDARLGKDAVSKGGLLGNHKRWHAGRGVVAPDCRYCQEDQR